MTLSVILMWPSEGFPTFPAFYVCHTEEKRGQAAVQLAKKEAFNAQSPEWRRNRHVDGWKHVMTVIGKIDFWIGEAWADLPDEKRDPM